MKLQTTLWIILGILMTFACTSFAGTLAGAKVFIAPQSNGFDVSLAAAMVKKHVPITIVDQLSGAQYKLESTTAQRFTSTGSKVARCLFADCVGIGGQRTDSVELVDIKTSEVVWAYNVRKAANGKQSAAEAVAKHLRKFILNGK